MSKVNFVCEFNSIMRYARDYCLSLRERMGLPPVLAHESFLITLLFFLRE